MMSVTNVGAPIARGRTAEVFTWKDGQVLKRYAPTDTPAGMAKDIEAALAA